MVKTVCFITLGCKVNQYDSEAMLELFQDRGYRSAPSGSAADVYVINTCTVTGTGDKKSMQMIRRCIRRNPQAEIVIAGCPAPERRARRPAVWDALPDPGRNW